MQLNCSQLAVVLGVARHTVSAWIRRGYFVPVGEVRHAKLFNPDQIRNALLVHDLKVSATAFHQLGEIAGND